MCKYLLIALVCFASCKTARNVQKFARQVDSTGFFKRDSSVIRHIDSVYVENDKKIQHEEQQNDYEEWTVIEEYKDTPLIKKTTVHMKDKGKRRYGILYTSMDSGHSYYWDSIKYEQSQAVTKAVVESAKFTAVKKTQGGAWWNLAFLAAFAVGAYYIYRRYIA